MFWLLWDSEFTHPPPPTPHFLWRLSFFLRKTGKQPLACVVAGPHAGHWRSVKGKTALPRALSLGFWPRLPPCLCPGAGRAPPPWLPFPARKPESLFQLGNRESCAGPWLGGKSRMGRLAAGRMRRWQGCMCCAIVCYLSGSCKNKCLEFDSVCQDPLFFLHLDFLNRSCFSLD